MSFSVFEKIDPSCQNGSMEKAKNIPYHQRPYASIAERTLVDISIYSPRPQIAGTGHSHSKISIHSPRAGRDCRYPNAPLITQISIHSPHTGRDRLVNAPIVSPSLFQSTLPAWGETANAHNFSKRKTGASAQHCIFSPAKRFFLLTKKLFREKKQTVFSVRTVQENRGSSRIAPTIEELDHQNPFGVIRSLCAYMLYLRFVTISEIVEAKAILSRVDQLAELSLKQLVLSGVQVALKDRILDSLAVCDTLLRHLAQTTLACRIRGRNVVGDQHQHNAFLTSIKRADSRPDRRADNGPEAATAHREPDPS